MIIPPAVGDADRPLRVAVTCGEPAGIGAEVALKALVANLPSRVEPVLVGPQQVWREAARLIGEPAMESPGRG